MFTGPETFNVAGTQFYEDDFLSLASPNPDFSMKKRDILDEFEEGEKIFKYDFPENPAVELIPEPENEYDKNAIRVELDGVKVGYIKRGRTGRVRNLMAEPGVKVRAEIFPGTYKVVEVDYDEDGDEKETVTRRDYSPSVKLVFYTDSVPDRPSPPPSPEPAAAFREDTRPHDAGTMYSIRAGNHAAGGLSDKERKQYENTIKYTSACLIIFYILFALAVNPFLSVVWLIVWLFMVAGFDKSYHDAAEKLKQNHVEVNEGKPYFKRWWVIALIVVWVVRLFA